MRKRRTGGDEKQGNQVLAPNGRVGKYGAGTDFFQKK